MSILCQKAFTKLRQLFWTWVLSPSPPLWTMLQKLQNWLGMGSLRMFFNYKMEWCKEQQEGKPPCWEESQRLPGCRSSGGSCEIGECMGSILTMVVVMMVMILLLPHLLPPWRKTPEISALLALGAFPGPAASTARVTSHLVAALGSLPALTRPL